MGAPRPSQYTGVGTAPGRRHARIAPAAVLAWLVLWQVAALVIDSELLLPGPIAVASRLAGDVLSVAFWMRVGFSTLRIAGGVLIGWVIGIASAMASAKSAVVQSFLEVPLSLARSVPVASFTVLALIWLRASNLAVLVVALVVTPTVHENLLQALVSRDRALDEMATVLRVPRLKRLRLVDLPQLAPSIRAALKLTLGMGWKAGVAAEVIGIPFGSIGEALYQTKVQFDTAGLFSWTATVVAASLVSERTVRSVLDHAIARLTLDAGFHRRFVTDSPIRDVEETPQDSSLDIPTGASALIIHELLCPLSAERCIGPVNLTAKAGAPCALMAPSGAGKTTLLLTVAGTRESSVDSIKVLDTSGKAVLHPHVAMVFQDARLCDQASALDNTLLAAPSDPSMREKAKILLEELGLAGQIHQAAGSCSGGERRRIAIARALMTPADLLLLDEPFTGLDPSSRNRCAALINRYAKRMPVVIATHDPEDATLLDAHIIRW